ncbi:MAG: SLC26A/SulP transporter family protein [Candidatus Anammoxibacter sp.]
MKKHLWISQLAGDSIGGSTAAMLAIPEAMAYGMIVFAPLGAGYVAFGAAAGLIALCFSNIGAAGCGGVRIMSNGPYSLTSLMLASSLTVIITKVPDGNIVTILGLLFMMVFLCGLFQLVFGLLKVGKLVKYIPYPVTSGLFNGTAILIFWAQIRPILGIPQGTSLMDIGATRPFTLLIGLFTIVVAWASSKLTKKIPAPLLGIAAGSIVYYILSITGFKENLGATIGSIPFTVPTPKYALDFWTFLVSNKFLRIIAELIPMSLSIAIVASLQSMIASVSADNLLRKRSNTNRELIGQGIGNMVSSFFGGIVCAGSQSKASVNYFYGGRTWNSRLITGFFVLIILLCMGAFVSRLPNVVFAATLIMLAFKIFDPWSLKLITRLFVRGAKSKQMLSDLFVVALVTSTLVAVDVFKAVGAGIFISVMFFIFRMSKDVIRRKYDGKRIRSNILRPLKEIKYLEDHGAKIMVFELEGSLFFGTADKIASAIDEVIETEADYIVVDMRRVSDIDSTGANILMRTRDRCQDKQKYMALSSINLIRGSYDIPAMLSLSEDMEYDDNRYKYFETIDDALGWAEDMVLDEPFGTTRYENELSLVQIDVLAEFSDPDLKVIREYLTNAVYEPGDVIYEQGTSGDRVYFLAQGKVQIVVNLPQGNGKYKLATLCSGTVFGEMAFIDQGLRSANVIAETHIACYCMSSSELNRFNMEQPRLAHKLFIGFARELSMRVRIANRIITELKR